MFKVKLSIYYYITFTIFNRYLSVPINYVCVEMISSNYPSSNILTNLDYYLIYTTSLLH